MGVMFRKSHGLVHATRIGGLSFVAFLIALASAFISAVWSLFLDAQLGSAVLVGLAASLFSLVGFFSFFLSVPLLQRYRKSTLLSLALIGCGVLYLLLGLGFSSPLVILFGALLSIFLSLRVVTFGIIVKSISEERNLSRNVGLTYTFFNLAFILGPLLAGFLLNTYGYPVVFYSASFFVFLGVFLFALLRIRVSHTEHHIESHTVRNFFSFFKDRQRVIAYFLSGGVNFWWALIYIYLPLHFLSLGASAFHIGFFLGMISLPLVLFEYSFSLRAKRTGYRSLFAEGYLLVAAISFLAFFVHSPFVLMGVFLFSSVGIAMLEPTTESFFLGRLRTKEEENRFYGPYNTAIDLGLFLGKFVPALLLLVFPLTTLFLFFGGVMLALFFLSRAV